MKYLILIAALAFMNGAEAKWKYSAEADEMTDKTKHRLRVSSLVYDYSLTLACRFAGLFNGTTGRLLSGGVVFRFGDDKSIPVKWSVRSDAAFTDDFEWLLTELRKGQPMKVQIDEKYSGYEYLRTGAPSRRDMKELDKFTAACLQQGFLDELDI